MPEISAELVDKLSMIAAAIVDFVNAIRQTADPLSSDIAAQVADRVRRGVCLQCETVLANEKRVTRGLCYTCYAKSVQRIKRQQTTETWLIANGFILAESSKGGRKSQRPDPVGAMLTNREAVTDATAIEDEALMRQAREKKKEVMAQREADRLRREKKKSKR